MNRKLWAIAVVILYSLNSSGCWDARDIDNMSFPIAAAYDLHPPSQPVSRDPGAMQYHPFIDVTVLSPNLTEDTQNKIRVEKISSPTTAFARNNRPLDSGSYYQPAAVQVLILGQDLAKIGVAPYMDTLFRSPIIPSFIHLAVTPGRGEDVLLTPVKNFSNAGLLLRRLLTRASSNAFVVETTLHDFALAQAPGKNPVLPVIEKTGETGLHLTGSSIFKKDQLISIINLKETQSLVLLRGVKSRGFVPFNIMHDDVLSEFGTVYLSNRREVEVRRSGEHFTFFIEITLEGILEDHSSAKEIDETKIRAIEEQVAADICSECNDFLGKMQNEFKVDCIDISKYALAKWRRELTPVIDKDFIENVDIQVQVKLVLTNAGEAT